MDLEKYMIPCLSKKLFGVECLGCGMQRSFILICQGEFEKAFFMYPPIYTILLFFFFLGLHFFDKSRNYYKVVIGLALVNFIIMLVSYILKPQLCYYQ